MPIFDFTCSKNHTTEELTKHDVESIKCPICGKQALRQISGKHRFQFKVGHSKGTTGGHTMQ